MPRRGIRGGLLKFIDEQDLDMFYFAILEVLEEVGILMEYRPALEMFRDHGADVDFEKKIVKISEGLLKKALLTAPSRFTLHGKTPEWDVKVDLERVYTISGSCALSVLDLDGVHRPATRQDLIDLTRLLDTLPHLDIMHQIVVPSDVHEIGYPLINFSTCFSHSTRNYYSQAHSAESVRDQIKMAAVYQGSEEEACRKPMFTEVVCMVSPLKHEKTGSEVLMESAKWGIPIYVEVDAMCGSTTPAPIAGTLVEQAANVLAGVVLAQLVNPGVPCIFAIASGIMDMRTGAYAGSAPESNLIHAATAQIAHYFGLPYQGGTGIEAKVPDAQAGYERALHVLTNILAGTNFVHLIYGMMEQMLLASYEQCLIDEEIIGAAIRIAKGFDVTDYTLSVDLLSRVGPLGKHFLTQKETREFYRQDRWEPTLTDRSTWDTWERAGAKSMRQRANDLARKILAEERPMPVTKEQAEEIERIAQDGVKRAIERVKKREEG
ncbi:MAG: trimethylamine methyltransferase family protein [Anaerolineae bacterium]